MNKALFCSLVSCFLMLANAPASASEEPGQTYVTGMVSGVWVDSDRPTDDDLGWHLGWGKAVSEAWNIELNLVGAELGKGSDGSPSQDQLGIGFDVIRVWYREESVSPYILLGTGMLETDSRNDEFDGTDIMLSTAFGLLTDLSDNLSLRSEIRWRADFQPDDQVNDLLVSVGLQYAFGDKPEPAAVDSDNDGVIDPNDMCPGTPAGRTVDARGCELDSDGDGVVDGLDACPGTPAGTAVDARGCPLDSDDDGVLDGADDCPNTPAGTRVDIHGCEIKQSARLEGVQFRLNSAELTPGSESVLDDVAASLANNPDLRVELGGYTDSSGADSYNLNLSQQRADSVRAYLISRGVDGDNLVARGYGEADPVADNSTTDGRAQNRRVMMRLLND